MPCTPSAADLASESVAGEEDPGAALDLMLPAKDAPPDGSPAKK
ncbi:MAG: hypothetical protein V4731_14010 [Pseudomonadota bacterium]